MPTGHRFPQGPFMKLYLPRNARPALTFALDPAAGICRMVINSPNDTGKWLRRGTEEPLVSEPVPVSKGNGHLLI